MSLEHIDNTWPTSQTKEYEVLGTDSLFVPGRVLTRKESKQFITFKGTVSPLRFSLWRQELGCSNASCGA